MSVAKIALLPSRAVLQEFESRYAKNENRVINEILHEYSIKWTYRDFGYEKPFDGDEKNGIEYNKIRVFISRYFINFCGAYIRSKIINNFYTRSMGNLSLVPCLNRKYLWDIGSYFPSDETYGSEWNAEKESTLIVRMINLLAGCKGKTVSSFSNLERVVLLGIEKLDDPIIKKIVDDKMLDLKETQRKGVEYHIGETGIMLSTVYM